MSKRKSAKVEARSSDVDLYMRYIGALAVLGRAASHIGTSTELGESISMVFADAERRHRHMTVRRVGHVIYPYGLNSSTPTTEYQLEFADSK